MPHIKTNRKYVDIKDQFIYVLLSPIGKDFFVGQVKKGAERNRFKDHFILNYKQTNTMVSKVLNQGEMPKMYLLETLKTTTADGFDHCLAWIRYFFDYGYECVNYPKTKSYAEEPTEAVGKIFEQIKERSLAEILSNERDMFPNYKEKKENKNETDLVTISFRVKPKDAEMLREKARKRNQSMAQLCRDTVLDGCTVNVNFNFLSVYLAELKGVKSLARQTMMTIYKTGNYYQPDLDNLQRMVEVLEKHERKITDELMDTMRTAKKEIRSARRKF